MAIVCATPFIFLLVIAALVIWIRMIVSHRRGETPAKVYGCASLIACSGLAATGAAILTVFIYRPSWKMHFASVYALIINTAFVAILASFPCFIVMELLSGFVPPRKRLLALLTAGLTAAALAGGFLLWLTSTSHETATVIKAGNLAALPESATDVKTFGWCCTTYLAFRAEADDIDIFLSNSPSTRDAEPTVFDADHTYLPKGAEYRDDSEIEFFHAYYYPDWFDPAITEKGRKYDIPLGTLVVNDATKTVYVEIIWY